METYRRYALPLFLLLVLLVGTPPAWGAVTVQCPGDLDGDAIPDEFYTAETLPDPNPDDILIGAQTQPMIPTSHACTYPLETD